MQAHKKAYTLIELVMVIVLLGILAVTGTVFFGPIMNLVFFAPKESLATDIGGRTTDIIVEGTPSALGVRYSKLFTTAEADRMGYKDANDNIVVFRWDSGTKRIYRKINSQTEQTIPPAMGSSVAIDGTSSGVIFKYYNSAGTQLTAPVSPASQVKRVQMDWVLQTGSGSVSGFQGKITLSTGADIKQYY